MVKKGIFTGEIEEDPLLFMRSFRQPDYPAYNPRGFLDVFDGWITRIDKRLESNRLIVRALTDVAGVSRPEVIARDDTSLASALLELAEVQAGSNISRDSDDRELVVV